VSISTEVGKVLQEITGSNAKVNSLVGEIAAASNEQAQGIQQVNTAMGQMDKVTQSNAANAEESASAAEELSAQAEQLTSVVGELLALVGGQRATTHMAVGPQLSRRAGGMPQKLVSTSGVKDAKQLIPLEESNKEKFSEFSQAA
jgi:methyl-accepting chemotaxis protein